MYFTGLSMVAFPEWQYLIYGVSWWATFQGIGLTLESRSGSRHPAARADSSRPSWSTAPPKKPWPSTVDRPAEPLRSRGTPALDDRQGPTNQPSWAS